MSVYCFGLTYTEITAELPHMTFGAATKPTTTQITAWITLYSAEVVTRLEALGVADQSAMSTTITASVNEAQYYAIRNGIIQAVTARTHIANQEQDTELATAHREAWQEFLLSLDTMPWKKLGDIETKQRPRSSWDSDRAPFWRRDNGFT